MNGSNTRKNKKCVKSNKEIGKGTSGIVYNTNCSNKKNGNHCNFTTDECHNGVIKVIDNSNPTAKKEIDILKRLANPGSPYVLKFYDERENNNSRKTYLYLNKAGNKDLFDLIKAKYENKYYVAKYIKEFKDLEKKFEDLEKKIKVLESTNINNPEIQRLKIEKDELLKKKDELQKKIKNLNKFENVNFLDKEINKIMKDIINGMCYIFEKGYVHNDLKPENLLIKENILLSNSKNPAITIIDFGISGKIGDETNSLLFYGTPQYMSPEKAFSYIRFTYDQKKTKYTLNIADDIWAIGCIYYFILLISPPWEQFNLTRDNKSTYNGGFQEDFLISLANMAEVPLESNLQIGDILNLRGNERRLQFMPNFGDKILNQQFKNFFFGSVKERNIETLKKLRDHLNAGKSIFQWEPPMVA